jgi:hypothetical protein
MRAEREREQEERKRNRRMRHRGARGSRRGDRGGRGLARLAVLLFTPTPSLDPVVVDAALLRWFLHLNKRGEIAWEELGEKEDRESGCLRSLDAS